MEDLDSRLWPLLIVAALVGVSHLGCHRPPAPAAATTASTDDKLESASPVKPTVANQQPAEEQSPATAGPASEDRPADSGPPPSHARWLIHSERTVLVCEVHSSWNDQTQLDRSHASLQQIKLLCDTNQDGRTTWDEISDFSNLFPRPGGSDALPLDFLRTYDTNGDDAVDPAELRQFLSRGKLLIDGWLAIQVDRSLTSPLDSPTFRWLDEDDNGSLDADEIEHAPRRLRAIDADDDGLIWPADLTPRQAMRRFTPDQRSMTLTNVQRYVCGLGKATDWNRLAFDLEQRFSFGAPLTADDLPPGSPLSRLDLEHGDGDGTISPDELQHLASTEPDLSVWLCWDPPGLEIDPDESFSDRTTVRTTIQGIALGLTLVPPRDALPDFERIDSDGSESIDLQELAASAETTNLRLQAIDRNNDGTLDQAEFQTGATIDHLIHRAFVSARIFRAADPLFALLDANIDGRLDRRETDSAAEQLNAISNSRGHRIDNSELAASISVAFSTGLFADNRVDSPPSRPRDVDDQIDQPTWFVEMDLDNSGAIGADEFLGTTEVFEALDANQDGYLDLPEIKQR